MIKKSLITISILAALAGFSACNSDDSNSGYVEEAVEASSVQVTAFSLQADTKVLNNLDSVFFSIDLKNATIFNADSLPYGTKVSRLIPVIKYPTVSVAELTYTYEEGKDSVVDYLKNSTDSIDFSKGPAKLRLVSYNGTTERVYTIKVNVHNQKPDSLYWSEAERRNLPTSLTSPVRGSKTVKTSDKLYCLTESAAGYSVATATHPESSWQYATPSFGFTPLTYTFHATGSKLFILGTDEILYTSDNGIDWTSTGKSWMNIIAAYDDTLLGVAEVDGKICHVTYPESSATPADEDFPVLEASNEVRFTSEWSSSPQIYIVGGVTASQKVSNLTWGYDGKSWHKVSNVPLPKALYGVSLVPFEIFITEVTNWSVSSYPILIAIGGTDDKSVTGKTVYISYNQGMNWKEASPMMQLPAYMPAMSGAQPFVFSSILGDSKSRASAPITEWECPYIYLFGGVNDNGAINSVWRGTLLRLTYKPLQ